MAMDFDEMLRDPERRLSGDEKLARAGITRVSSQAAIGMDEAEFARTVDASCRGSASARKKLAKALGVDQHYVFGDEE